jgi:hypothetical protein
MMTRRMRFSGKRKVKLNDIKFDLRDLMRSVRVVPNETKPERKKK